MQVTLCRMLVPVLPKELSVFPQPATNPVWPVKGRMILKKMPSVMILRYKKLIEVIWKRKRREKEKAKKGWLDDK